jgi:hypothetical protein
MGYYNPDFYYHQLLMDKATEVAELKNEIIRLKKIINQQQKELKQC